MLLYSSSSNICLKSLLSLAFRAYFELKAQFYLAYAYNYLGESLLAEDKCGEAIRCLQESTQCYSKAGLMAAEYTKVSFLTRTE